MGEGQGWKLSLVLFFRAGIHPHDKDTVVDADNE
jgi:hypothetical protein